MMTHDYIPKGPCHGRVGRGTLGARAASGLQAQVRDVPVRVRAPPVPGRDGRMGASPRRTWAAVAAGAIGCAAERLGRNWPPKASSGASAWPSPGTPTKRPRARARRANTRLRREMLAADTLCRLMLEAEERELDELHATIAKGCPWERGRVRGDALGADPVLGF